MIMDRTFTTMGLCPTATETKEYTSTSRVLKPFVHPKKPEFAKKKLKKDARASVEAIASRLEAIAKTFRSI